MSDLSHYYHDFEEDRNYIKNQILNDKRAIELVELFLNLVKLEQTESFKVNQFSMMNIIKTDIIRLIEDLISVSPTTKCSVEECMETLY